LAVANYHDAEGHLPPAVRAPKDGGPGHTWRIQVLPYLSYDHLHRQYDVQTPWDAPTNSALAGQMPKLYALHGDHKPGLTTTNYLAVVGPNTLWRPGKPVTLKDVTDGTSNTILIPENRGLNVPWMSPWDLDFNTMDWTINSPSGISSKYDAPAAVMMDGSVRRLSPTITPAALRALATMDGGEPLAAQGGHWELLPDGRQRPVTNP
jgi:hypothetical protein